MKIEEKTYMVLDLKDYSVSYLDDVPEGGWTDEYKTEKMALRYIPAGSFVMGSPESELSRHDDETQHKVTLTSPFCMGVFQVTQKQYELITGDDPSHIKGKKHPVECVSYDMIRGRKNGSMWPYNNSVDKNSFFGILRAKAKLDFDLPTEAQWEYACRAGAKTTWNNGTDITDKENDYELAKLGRYSWSGGYDEYHAEVGSYLPNAWGLYDMHGNVLEHCLDWYGEYPNAEVTDPRGAESGEKRVLRGGSCGQDAFGCRSAYRYKYYPCEFFFDLYGFRVVTFNRRTEQAARFLRGWLRLFFNN